ncbi:MAG: autotransporter-associated beta strand repeat-containing protein, partial [Planctomycetaceae bacterium]
MSRESRGFWPIFRRPAGAGNRGRPAHNSLTHLRETSGRRERASLDARVTPVATEGVAMRGKAFNHLLAVAFAIAGVLLNGHLGHVAHAALVAGWDFQTTTNGGTAVAASPSTPKLYVANFGSGTLYLNGSEGSSNWFVPASGSTDTELNGFAGSNVNTAAGFSTTTTSPAALAVVSGSANAANGKFAVFKFSMTGYQDLVISLSAQRTATGFATQVWEFSTDGTTYSSIGSLLGGSTAGTIRDSFVNTGTLTLPTVTGFNNATNAFVRVTFTGATTTTGNNRLDNIQFNASTFTPPSGTLTWSGNGSTAGGVGTWTITGSNWSTTGSAPFSSTWSASSKAVFGTSGGIVTVDAGGITAASGIDFNVDGYTLSGGGLTLGGTTQNLVSVAAASTATVDSVLSGSAGLTKTSAGTLVLNAANTFTGNVTISSGTLQIAGDSSLGNAANDVVINGALRTTASGTLGAGRDVTG